MLHVFSAFSLMQPFKNGCQLALKRMKIKFLLPFTMNTKAVLDASQPSSRNQYVRSDDINSCCGIRRHWSRRPNRQPNGNSATVYSSLTHKSSQTPWIPCFKTLAFTKCTLCFISQSIWFICSWNWLSLPWDAQPGHVHWPEFSHLRLDALLVSTGIRCSTVIKYNLSVVLK